MVSNRNIPQQPLVREVEHVIRQIQKPRLLPDPGAIPPYLHTSSPYYSPDGSELGRFEPGFLRDLPYHGAHSPCKSDTSEDYSDLFDWVMWGDDDAERAGSKSDTPSMPDLTSASSPPQSDEGGSPPRPRHVPDNARFKAQLKEAKKSDDKLTFPLLKPKGTLPRHSHIHLPGVGTQASATPILVPASRRDSSLLSPPASPQRADAPGVSSAARGRRSGPLKNGDAVAEVRALGACLCCRVRKVACDDQQVCANCEKRGRDRGASSMVDQLCVRNPFLDNRLLFQTYSKTSDKRSTTAARSRGSALDMSIFFSDGSGVSDALPISVVVEGSPGRICEDAQNYRHNVDRPLPPQMLSNWAAKHTSSAKVVDYSTSIDVLVLSYVERGRVLPHYDLVSKMHQLRCLYKVWSQKEFALQRAPGVQWERLPKPLHKGIRDIAKDTMKRLEKDVLGSLEKLLTGAKGIKAPAERMAIWMSLMQLVFMYRDFLHSLEESARVRKPDPEVREKCEKLHLLASTLFSALVTMCDVCFTKKAPEPLESPRSEHRSINEGFRMAWSYRDSFFDGLNIQPSSLDKVLSILRVEKKKSHAAKRQKTSK